MDVPRNRAREQVLRRLYRDASFHFIDPATVSEEGAVEVEVPESGAVVIPFYEEFDLLWGLLQRAGTDPGRIAPHAGGYRVVEVHGHRLMVEGARFAVAGRTVDPADMRALLVEAAEVLAALDVPHLLAFGSLLGFVRDGSVIPGDTDGDIAIHHSAAVDLTEVCSVFAARGLVLVRATDDLLSFQRNGSYLDLYLFRRRRVPGVLQCLDYTLRVDDFHTPARISVGPSGPELPIPRRAEKLFERWYGRDWRVPQAVHAQPNNVVLSAARRSAGLAHRLAQTLRDLASVPVSLLRALLWRRGRTRTRSLTP